LFYSFVYVTRKKTAADRGFIAIAEIISWLQVLVLELVRPQVQLVLQEHLS
jgi:hypothetical protein